MSTLFIRDFIESNVHLLETEDYEQFFMSYEQSVEDAGLDWDDTEYTDELLEILSKLGIKSKTEAARVSVIKKIVSLVVTNTKYHGVNYIDISMIKTKLPSYLGFGHKLVEQIIINHVSSIYKYDAKSQRVYLR